MQRQQFEHCNPHISQSHGKQDVGLVGDVLKHEWGDSILDV